MEDDSIKKGADLLVKHKGTMTDIPCPICHDPIFRLKDNSMICVNCDKKVIWEKDVDNSSPESDNKTGKLQSVISKKISQLESQLLEETNHDKILEIAELINKLEKLV